MSESKRDVYDYVLPLGIIFGIILIIFNSNEKKNTKLNENKNVQKVISFVEGKPSLELTNIGTDKCQIIVKDFEYKIAYGIEGIGQRTVKGDFEKLDEKLFKKLREKKGICKVYFKNIGKDEYGNTTENDEYMCTIDLNELNRYNSDEYWHKAGGILKCIDNNQN